MALKLFADQCIPDSIIRTLSEAGHDVIILGDHIPITSIDEDVIAKAQELDAILLSLNGDFADIVTYPPSEYKGIIALRLRNHPEAIPQLMIKLISYLSVNPDHEHYAGKLFLVEVHRIRVKAG